MKVEKVLLKSVCGKEKEISVIDQVNTKVGIFVQVPDFFSEGNDISYFWTLVYKNNMVYDSERYGQHANKGFHKITKFGNSGLSFSKVR